MTPAVTVVVTSFNYGRYVGAALESICAQTMANFECVVVDDGSTDNSIAIVDSFLNDTRFRLVKQQNRGVSQARNVGIGLATTPFIAFLDADDLWQPNKLQCQIDRFRSEPNLGVVYTRRTIVNEAGIGRPAGDPTPIQGQIVGPLFQQNFVCFSSAMVRTDAALRVGGFDERLGLAVDYDFWMRIARHYPFGVVDEPLVAYRIGHGVNLSRRQRERYHVALYVMRRFERHFDNPAATLSPAEVARAEAETFAHLGQLSRGISRRTEAAWLIQSLRVDPHYRGAWRGLIAALAPASMRTWLRRIRGTNGDWEQQGASQFNRPEAVL